jgi:hypothetical protein
VQSTGNFVAGAVELPAGVQLGHYHLGGGHLLIVNHHVVHGNAAAVVHHRDGVVDVDGDFDLVGESGQRFVHGVIHDFVHQVVQAKFAGRADVHGGALAHGLHSPEHLDGFGVVFVAAVSIGGVRLAVGRLSVLLGLSQCGGIQSLFGCHSAPLKNAGVGLSARSVRERRMGLHPIEFIWT